MKAETIIKQQARSSLADQNWGVALAAFIFPACVFFMAQTVNSFSIIVRGASVQALTNAPFARPQALLFFLLLQVLAVGVLFAFSPIFVGAAKLYTDIAHGRQGELSALFGWFSGKRQYGRAVAFSLSLAVRNVLWALLCFFPCGFFVVLLRIFPVVGSGPLQEGIRLLWYLFLALLILLGLTLWVVLTSRYFLAPYLFLYKEELSANTCIIQSIFLMKKNRSRYLRLVLSFLPWLLSCFFVIPALYVMPYFQTACAFNARWMLEEAGEGIP